MKIFDDILNAAAGFVEKQKGFWDHTAWDGFVRDMRARGFQFSDEMLSHLGQVLDSMKKFYRATSIESVGIDPGKILDGVAEQAAKFVAQTKGMWDHDKWEHFLADIRKRGVNVSGDTALYLGEMLESVKRIYSVAPSAAAAASKAVATAASVAVAAATSKVVATPDSKAVAEAEKSERVEKKPEPEATTPEPEATVSEPSAADYPAKKPDGSANAASGKTSAELNRHSAPAGGAKRGPKRRG